MASVTFKILKNDNVTWADSDNQKWTPAYKEGQIIFAKGEKKIYLDFDGDRTCYTPDVSSNGMNFIGIVDEKPTGGTVKIGGKDVIVRENDMVVFGTKEYIYRKDKGGNSGWFEIGDESAPEWS